MKIRTIAVHGLVLCGIAACRPGGLAGGMSDSTFVAVMSALRKVNTAEGMDSARRVIARDSVLQSRDLTAETLERAARDIGADPDRAVGVWQEILKRSPGEPAR
jgi:hypothetical protein